MGELDTTNESDATSPDLRPWGEEFPSKEAFKAYAQRRYQEDTNTSTKQKIKPNLTTVTAIQIAKYWDIDWDHIVYSSRQDKIFGDLDSTIDYLYTLLQVAIDSSNPQRDSILNDSFLIKPNGDIYNGGHRAAALILIGPQFLEANGFSNLIKPTVIT